jgi:hypothetical protein
MGADDDAFIRKIKKGMDPIMVLMKVIKINIWKGYCCFEMVSAIQYFCY